MVKSGWYNESARHSLAAKGVPTGRKMDIPAHRAQFVEEEKGYNGWTNHATWAVKLNWDNNESDYDYFTSMAKEYKAAGKEPYELADALKEEADEIFENVHEAAEGKGGASKEAVNFVRDVRDLDDVNWNEIAKAYYDEVDE